MPRSRGWVKRRPAGDRGPAALRADSYKDKDEGTPAPHLPHAWPLIRQRGGILPSQRPV